MEPQVRKGPRFAARKTRRKPNDQRPTREEIEAKRRSTPTGGAEDEEPGAL